MSKRKQAHPALFGAGCACFVQQELRDQNPKEPPLTITIRSGFPNNFYLILAEERTKSETFLLLERLFDRNRDGDGAPPWERNAEHFGWE